MIRLVDVEIPGLRSEFGARRFSSTATATSALGTTAKWAVSCSAASFPNRRGTPAA